ncbi:MAG: HAD family phosphatase [Ilumatobacter sp.]|uniref:HAD family hydrolase n=1 Tax=Ilumatobacter sp. TaxID=1967498 RepID=UPI003C73BC65
MVDGDRRRAVVFDFGGVLITTIANQIGNVAADLGVQPDVLHRVLLGPRGSTPDHPWHRAERGDLAVASIQAGLDPWAEQAGIELRGDEIDRLLAPGEYTIVEPMVRRVEALRSAGVRTGLLTNTFAEFRTTMQRDLDFSLFDAVIESFAVGARKPEPAIYAATAAALGVAHSDIVYLDDFDQNLEPALTLGWTTVLVTDPNDALAELDEVLGRGARTAT